MPRPETIADTLVMMRDAAHDAGLDGATIDTSDQSLMINPDAGDNAAMALPARDLAIFAAASNVDGVAFLIEKREEVLATGAYPLFERL
jgi:hypothetical protein